MRRKNSERMEGELPEGHEAGDVEMNPMEPLSKTDARTNKRRKSLKKMSVSISSEHDEVDIFNPELSQSASASHSRGISRAERGSRSICGSTSSALVSQDLKGHELASFSSSITSHSGGESHEPVEDSNAPRSTATVYRADENGAFQEGSSDSSSEDCDSLSIDLSSIEGESEFSSEWESEVRCEFLRIIQS